LRGAYANPSSPLLQYQQLIAYRQATGGGSLSNIMMGMSDMTNPEVVNRQFKNLERQLGLESTNKINWDATGGEGMKNYLLLQNVKSQFGLSSLKVAKEFIDRMKKNNGMTSVNLQDYMPTDDLYQRTEARTHDFTSKMDTTALSSWMTSFGGDLANMSTESQSTTTALSEMGLAIQANTLALKMQYKTITGKDLLVTPVAIRGGAAGTKALMQFMQHQKETIERLKKNPPKLTGKVNGMFADPNSY
jgi:hypothetical protein